MSANNESDTAAATTTNTTTTTPTHPNTPSSIVPTKLCHIVKRSDFDGYGFNLHSEKIKPGQYIGKIDANSPASAAGLKEGDRIIEVNGSPIGSETHKQVVQRIKAISHEVRLLLIDANAPTATNGNVSKNSSSSIATSSASDNNNVEYQGSVKENAATTTTTTTTTTPPPPAVAVATAATAAAAAAMPSTTSAHNNNSNSDNNVNKVGSLQLPMTAAEMRAKLMSKKKYDPKNESVDLKKKFDIIQKL